MRRQRRQDVLHGAVFVDVAGDAERGEVAHFLGVPDRAAEHENRHPPVVDLPDRADQLHAAGMRQPQVEHEQIDAGRVGAHAGEQLCRALDGQRLVPGREERGREPVAHEGGIVGDNDGLVAHGLDCRIYQVLPIIRTSIADAAGVCMATCPECDAEIEVDEFDVDKGDLISCPDCGSNLEVTGTSPVELELTDDDDDDDEDEDAEERGEDEDDFDDDDESGLDEDDDSEGEDWDE